MAKIENLHINLLKRAKDNEEILGLLSISLFLKLKFTSSALHITSTRTICNHLHIGSDKFKKLQSSDLFDTMFHRTDGLFVARIIGYMGRRDSGCSELKSDTQSYIIINDKGTYLYRIPLFFSKTYKLKKKVYICNKDVCNKGAKKYGHLQ